jgi:hypothetical protein
MSQRSKSSDARPPARAEQTRNEPARSGQVRSEPPKPAMRRAYRDMAGGKQDTDCRTEAARVIEKATGRKP